MARRSEGVRLSPPVGEGDRVRGPADSPVTLVEFGDYDCPHTVRAYSVVRGLRGRLGDRLRFAFRAFPLTELHEHAQVAAEAAEASAAQGRFWEMHDRLFEAHRRLANEDLLRYADEAGLDSERFRRETDEHVYAGKVRENLLSGLRSEVRGTPTFFINGIRHDGSYDFETLLTKMRDREIGGVP